MVEHFRTVAGADAWFVNVVAPGNNGHLRAVIVAERDRLIWATYSFQRPWRKAVTAFRESGGDPDALGRVPAIAWGSVRSIAQTPAYRAVAVTYRGAFGWTRTRGLITPDSTAYADLFAAFHQRLGRDLPVERARVRVDQIPLGGEQAGAVLLFLFGIGALVAGAFFGGPEAHPGGAMGQHEALITLVAWLGAALGPVGASILAALAGAGGVALLVRTIARRPERLVVQAPDRPG